MAMAPMVAKAPSSGLTPAGRATHRFLGTRTYSAWWANSAPPHATQSPSRQPAPSPASTTTPQQL